MTYERKGQPTASFVARGFLEREVFSHRASVISKQYPDTFLLLEGRGISRAELLGGRFCQLNLYSDHLSGFPPELFTDRSVNWHSQQLGRSGLIAAAGLYLQADALVITVMQSDLCQQLFRHAELRHACKTQVEKRFGSWHRMLFNAVLDFALECGVPAVCCPTADWILAATKKGVRGDLFRRIYDLPDRCYQARRVTRAGGEYWEVQVAENTDRIVRLSPVSPSRQDEARTMIGVFHDLEEDVSTHATADTGARTLTRMLEIEREQGVAATYSVPGTVFRRRSDTIRASDDRHALGFHAFNHDVTDPRQLERCREIDQQVRGYRPPRSVITPDLTDYRLSYLNFEWLAGAESNHGFTICAVENGIVKIALMDDDSSRELGHVSYRTWEDAIVNTARGRDYLALGLHERDADRWLDAYAALLDRLSSVGDLVTADQIADQVFWRQGVDLGAPLPAVSIPLA